MDMDMDLYMARCDVDPVIYELIRSTNIGW
jgi:hypothetical protein